MRRMLWHWNGVRAEQSRGEHMDFKKEINRLSLLLFIYDHNKDKLMLF